jgi:hypothetical protein
MIYADGEKKSIYRLGMTYDEVMSAISPHFKDQPEIISKLEEAKLKWCVTDRGCFLGLAGSSIDFM